VVVRIGESSRSCHNATLRSTREARLSTYVISPHPEEPQYEVHIVGADGVRQTLLGFPTEADAKAWIAADQAREDPAPRRSPG
jgi:hypothetical protein